MVFVSKKCIVAIVLTAVILALTAGGIVAVAAHLPVVGTVVLDAGHGGIDGGVVGAQGVSESEINLAIVKILGAKLQMRGVRVVYTRKNADALHDVKRLDMQARKRIIEQADPDLVVSIHVNQFSDPDRRGAQVFYDDTGVGELFATVMQSALNTYINAAYSKRADYHAQSADLYITKCVARPSVIVECGFISNAQDEALLLTRAYRDDIAARIADVVCAMLGSTVTTQRVE